MSEEYMNKNLFEQDVKGFLFYTEPTVEGLEKSKLIFEWDPNALLKLREGDIVAVEAFSTLTEGKNGDNIFYTLLEITRTNPTHLTIDRLKRFRFMGAVREFLKESTKDFEEGDPRLIKDHIYIEAEAVNTDYLMAVSLNKPTDPCFYNKQSKPIMGRDTGVLLPRILERLINCGVEDGLSVGSLYSDYEKKKDIAVKARPHKLITHHYTVFGFTGSGKSNLNSTILSRLIEKAGLNVLAFDISDEYTALLSDVLHNKGILVLDLNDAPESLITYYGKEYQKKEEDVDKVSKDLAMKTKKPGVLDSREFEVVFSKVFEKLLREDRIKVTNLAAVGLTELDYISLFQKMKEHCDINPYSKQQFEQLGVILRKKMKEDNTIEKNVFGNFSASKENLDKLMNILTVCYGELGWNPNKPVAAMNIIGGLLETVKTLLEMVETEFKDIENYVNDNWILDNFVMNQREELKLCIIVSSNTNVMASFLSNFIDKSIWLRKKAGTKPPHNVLLSIDEAHEFIPQKPDSSDVQTCSKNVERLTRMGRKYGLGVCLSSQRVAYLNTTALSNCHTTFIGALPRSYDREAMNGAYGVSYEVLNRVVTFPPGHWYVVSSGAMGINNVPIRINSTNRESALARFFQEQKYLDGETSKILKNAGLLS
jgi:hypothetical protein